MTEPSPEEVRERLHAVYAKLLNAERPLRIDEQRKLAAELTDIYNYVSASVSQPSLLNVIGAQAAQREAVRKQLELDQKNLESHKTFVESTFERADQFFRAVQVAGYAAFFGLWALTKDFIDREWAALAALVMLFSASVFVMWEVAKATVLALALRRDARIASSSLEEFVSRRGEGILSKSARVTTLVQWRSTFWILSVVPALTSVIILGSQLGVYLIGLL